MVRVGKIIHDIMSSQNSTESKIKSLDEQLSAASIEHAPVVLENTELKQQIESLKEDLQKRKIKTKI